MRGFHGSHTKIMVTESSGFIGKDKYGNFIMTKNIATYTFIILIGTSNWSEDYFTTTAGISFVFEPVKKVQ